MSTLPATEPVTVMEHVAPDESVHEPDEKVVDPVPPTSYQTIVSPETEPVKDVRVAVHVMEAPTATDVAEQTLARLVFAFIVSCVLPEPAELLKSPL